MAVSISLAITQNSQSIPNNTSNVTVAVTAKWTYGSWNATGQCTGSITIDGTKYSFSGIKFNTSQKQTGSQVIMTKTVNIGHNADGTKKLDCSASFVTGVSSGTVSCTGSKTLTTIPRATTPTLSSSSVNMGSSVTITLNRASSSFTHDLAYSFAGGSYVTFKTGAGTSYAWELPDLASQVPSATSGTLTIRCITKSGSTTVGTKTVTMTAKVPTTVVPTISSVSLVEAVDGLAAQFGAYVKNKSKVKATIKAAGAKGSTIKSYSTTFQGATYEGSTWTSAVLTSRGSLSMTTTITDSRGRTAKKTTTLTVEDYYLPSITKLRAFRVNAETGAADPEGTRLEVNLAYEVAPVKAKNTADLVLEAKKSSDTTWTTLDTFTGLGDDIFYFYETIGGDPFSIDYQYDVRATLTDWFGAKTIYNAVPVLSGEVILDISADGKGVAIGTTAQRAGFEVGWITQVSGGFRPIVLPDGKDLNTLTTPNTYAGHSGKEVIYQNSPVAAGKSFTLEVLPAGEAGQIFQRLTTCSKDAPEVWVRHYYSNAWGNWLSM